MSIEDLLARLDGVKRTGQGRYVAKCPAHSDKHPSLSIRELDDRRLLLHDFGGCSVDEVLSAVGLTMADLFPERQPEHGRTERRPFPAADILRCVAFEATVVLCAATAMLSGEPLSSIDRDRLSVAAGRLHEALRAGGIHG